MDKPRVLIIEDDKEISDLLSQILTQNGYQTTPAFTGLEGLSLAKREAYISLYNLLIA